MNAVQRNDISVATLTRLLAEADAGPWWFDGRDIFHKPPGTNLDQVIITIPSAEETFHPSQGVNPATAKLASLAPDLAARVMELEKALRWLHRNDANGWIKEKVNAVLAREGRQ